METDEGTEQDLTGLTREGSTLGTPAYMSPEQIKALPVDRRSNIFSFGIIFYEMLTGVHPFRRSQPVETMGAILHEKTEPIASKVKGSTDLLEKTVNQLLAKDPEDRLQTIGVAVDRLTQISAQQGELGLTAFLRSRLGKRLALVLTAIVAILLTGWWILQQSASEVGAQE